jgi:hypothetical protein
MTQDTGEHTGPQLPQQSQAHPTNAETDSIRIDADRSYTDAAGTTVHPFMEITCKPNSDYYHRLTVDFYTGVLAVDSPVVIKIGDLEASQLTFMTLEDRKTITFLDRLPNSEISRLSSAQLIGVFAVKGSVVLAFQPFLEKESVGVAFDTSKLLTTARDSHPSCSQLLSDEITTQTGQREGEERFPLRLEISSECETFAFIQYRVDDGTEESGHFAPALRRNIVDLPVTLEAKQKIVVSTSYGYTVAHLVFRLNGQPVQPEWKTTDKGKVIRLNPRPTRAGPCSSAVPDNKNAEVVFQGQQSK